MNHALPFRVHGRTWLFVLLASLFAGTLLANPALQREAEARIAARLPAIAALKRDGLVGENNRGYLEVRGALNAEQATLVREDSADRRTLYEIVAQRTGDTVESVGQQRALQIARNSPPGVWLQAPDGTWYRK